VCAYRCFHPLLRHLHVYADVTLGTLQDQYEDIVTKLTESSSTQAAAPSVPINHVMYWGIGEVGLKDVNMAKAGDGALPHATRLFHALLCSPLTTSHFCFMYIQR
jgi:hypothetical protein